MKSVEHLKKIPLFQTVAEPELQHLDKCLKLLSVKKGDIIISEGEVGDCLFIIQHGKTRVVAEAEGADEPIVLSFLTSGDYFGEMSLITGDPRYATVIAENECSLWQLDKKDFDKLVINNPSISLSLTHMLSQRLNLANKARESSERYYKQRITPKGRLEEVDLIKLLKYAEENSLTGKLHLFHQEKTAIFSYTKGQLDHLDFEEKDEDAAMDEILDWFDGEFTIEPSIFKLSENVDEDIKKPEMLLEGSMLVNQYEKYLAEKFRTLIKFAGKRSIQSALNKSFSKFEKFFDVTADIEITTEPELSIHIHVENWSDKHSLFLAVLMRDVISTLSRDMVGMDFWEIKASDTDLDKILDDGQFYSYYEQALDFIKE